MTADTRMLERHVALNTIVLAACEALGFELTDGSVRDPGSGAALRLQGAKPLVCEAAPRAALDPAGLRAELDARERMLRDVRGQIESARGTIGSLARQGRLDTGTFGQIMALLNRIEVAAEIPF